MPKIKVKTPINHDGVLYEPGDTLECSKAQAETLCALGSGAPIGGSASAEEDAAETTAAAKPKTGKKGK